MSVRLLNIFSFFHVIVKLKVVMSFSDGVCYKQELLESICYGTKFFWSSGRFRLVFERRLGGGGKKETRYGD